MVYVKGIGFRKAIITITPHGWLSWASTRAGGSLRHARPCASPKTKVLPRRITMGSKRTVLLGRLPPTSAPVRGSPQGPETKDFAPIISNGSG